MARRIRVIEVPRDATMPAENITGPEWTAAQSQIANASTQAEMANTRVFDVRAYGDPFADEPGAVFAAAATDVAASGGGILAAPAGEYVFQSGFELPDGVYLEFPGSGNTHLDFSGMTTPYMGSAIYSEGSYTSLPALASAVEQGSRTIAFVSAPAVVPGDVILLYNTVDYSFNAARPEYRDGEYAKVLSVAGNTVTTTSARFSSYLANGTVTAHKLVPVRVGVSGARMTFINGSAGINIRMGTSLVFDDLDLSGSNFSHLAVSRCYDITISNVRAFDNSPSVNTNYGIIIGNSQKIVMDKVSLETTRHGLTNGGGNFVGCIPTRDILISDSFISGLSNSNSILGFGAHGNIEHCTFNNVVFGNGAAIGGDNMTFNGGRIDSSGQGVCIYGGSEMIGANFRFNDVEFRITTNWTAPPIYVLWNSTSNTRGNGVFRMVNPVFNTGPYKAATGTTLVSQFYVTGSSPMPSTNSIEIVSPVFLSSATPTGADMFGVCVRTGSGKGFKRVAVTNSTGPLGFYGWGLATEDLDLSGSLITDCPWSAVRISAPTSSPYSMAMINLDGIKVHRSQAIGIDIQGEVGRTIVTMRGAEAINCNLGSYSTGAGSTTMRVYDALRFVRQNTMYGSYGTASIAWIDSIINVTHYVDENNDEIGSVKAHYVSSGSPVVNWYFSGKGDGVPTHVAANGSTYRRLDGAAGSTFYVREGGAWVAK